MSEQPNQNKQCNICFLYDKISASDNWDTEVLTLSYDQLLHLRKPDFFKQFEKDAENVVIFIPECEIMVRRQEYTFIEDSEIKEWKKKIRDILTNKLKLSADTPTNIETSSAESLDTKDQPVEYAEDQLPASDSRAILKLDITDRKLWDHAAYIWENQPSQVQLIKIMLQDKYDGYCLVGNRTVLENIIQIWEQLKKLSPGAQIYRDVDEVNISLKIDKLLSDNILEYLSKNSQARDFVYTKLENEGFLCNFNFNDKEIEVINPCNTEVTQVFKILTSLIMEINIVGKISCFPTSHDQFCQKFHLEKKEKEYISISYNEKNGFKLIGTCDIMQTICHKLEKEELVCDVKRQEKCYNRDRNDKELYKMTQELGIWTINPNQRVCVMCGDVSSYPCDVLVLPVLRKDDTSRPQQPTAAKEGKFAEAFSKYTINQKKKCHLEQVELSSSKKTHVAYLLFPEKFENGEKLEKTTICESIEELCSELKKSKIKLDKDPIDVRIDLQDLKMFPIKKTFKPIIQGLTEGFHISNISTHFILSIPDKTDAVEFTEVLKDVVSKDSKRGECSTPRFPRTVIEYVEEVTVNKNNSQTVSLESDKNQENREDPLSSVNPSDVKVPPGVQQKQEESTKRQKEIKNDNTSSSDILAHKSETFLILLKHVQSLNGNMDKVWAKLAKNKITSAAVLHPNPLTSEDEAIIVLKKTEDFQNALKFLSDYKPQKMSMCLDKSQSYISKTVLKKLIEDKHLMDELEEKTGLDIKENGLIEGSFVQLTAAFKFCDQLFHPNTEIKKLEIDAFHFKAVKQLKIVDENQLKKNFKTNPLPSDKIELVFQLLTTHDEEILLRIQSLIREEIKLEGVNEEKVTSVVNSFSHSTLEVFSAHIPEQQIIVMFGEDRNKLENAKRKIQVDLGQLKTRSRANRTFSSTTRTMDSKQISNIQHQLASNTSMTEVEPLVRGKLLDVMVYKGDITRLSVDAIVNAANGQLAHGAGVARAIADAAGDELVKEGNRYIGEHGEIPVSGVVVTTAGRLPYKKVLHAVGPVKYKYTDFTECLDVLCETILRCLCEARKLNMTSVAIPAISSGIYGVPKQSCAQMYVRAVKSFDAVISGGSLTNVHFVDINEEMLQLIQQEFVKERKESLNDDILKRNKKFIDQCLADADVTGDLSSSRSVISTAEFSASKPSQSYAAAASRNHAQSTSSADAGIQIIVYKEDIFNVQCKGLVCWKNPSFTYGDHPIAQKIFDKAGKQYKNQISEEKKKNYHSGSVFSTDGGNLHQHLIIHGVISNLFPRVTDFKNLIPQIVSKVDQKKLQTFVIPVFRHLSSNSVKIFTETLCQVVKNFSKKNPKSTLKQIHVVDLDQKVVDFVNEIVIKSGVNDETPRSETDGFKDALTQNSQYYQVYSAESATAVDNCTICMDTMTNPVMLNKCGHSFCKECLDTQIVYKPVCPSCGVLFGVLTGTMPTSGKMNVSYSKFYLPGYEHYGSYTIEYSFAGGKQTKGHPNEGTWYKGIIRTAYLPDSPEGRTVLAMLRVAWDRRLTFTIGRSVTTGQEGVITWNDIHHKTNTHGGQDRFGYPDPGYLARVTAELADKGITEESIKDPKYKKLTGCF